MKKNFKMVTAIALALVMMVSALAGCGQIVTADDTYGGGVIRLKVNPELGITYDENGNVVGVEARNDDGEKILDAFEGYKGKDAAQVISELVEIMGQAGYFVEEIEGEGSTGRQITIELEDGSKLPQGLTMDDVVSEVTECVKSHHWAGFVVLDDDELYELDDDDRDDDDDDDICPVCGEEDCDVHDDDDDEICDICGGHHDDDIHDVDDDDDDDHDDDDHDDDDDDDDDDHDHHHCRGGHHCHD